MRKENFEIAVLTTEKFLISFYDIVIAPFFIASPVYRKSMTNYAEESGNDKAQINERIQYLKRIKCVRICVEGKEKYLELLPRGIKRLEKIVLDNLSITKPDNWDKKWRVVIFDVPEKKHYERDSFRLKLKEMGFIQVQKSVYVFPFPCTDEITYLSQKLNLIKYVTIMISEIIQGEEGIIDRFVQQNILSKKHLSKQAVSPDLIS